MLMEKLSLNVIYASIVALGGFIFGFDASVISGVTGFVTNEFLLDEIEQGLVVGAPTLGAVLGSFVAGPLADAIGRKKVLLIIACLYVFSAIVSAFAPSYVILVVARAIGGLAFASLVLAPMYIAEISPAKLRGKMISINQFSIVIGFSAAYFANYFLLQFAQSNHPFALQFNLANEVWRWMLAVEIIPAMFFFFMLLMIPESPRWLILNGKQQAAKSVISKLFPNDNVENVIKQIAEHSQTHTASIFLRVRQLFGGHYRAILIVGIVVGVSQQITGVNAVYFYAPSIFEQSGIGQDAAFSQAIWVGVINVIFTLIAMFLIDTLGRKPLMVIGLTGVAISMCCAAIGFSQAKYQLTPESIAKIEVYELQTKLEPLVGIEYTNDVAFKAAMKDVLGPDEARKHQSVLIQAAAHMNPTIILLGILGFVASFAVSLGPVMWVLLAEIFPNHLRGVGIAVTGLINSIVSFNVQLLFPVQLTYLGSATTFMIYGVFAVIALVLVSWLLPETKGKTLEDIEDVFANRASTQNMQDAKLHQVEG